MSIFMLEMKDISVFVDRLHNNSIKMQIDSNAFVNMLMWPKI